MHELDHWFHDIARYTKFKLCMHEHQDKKLALSLMVGHEHQ